MEGKAVLVESNVGDKLGGLKGTFLPPDELVLKKVGGGFNEGGKELEYLVDGIEEFKGGVVKGVEGREVKDWPDPMDG